MDLSKSAKRRSWCLPISIIAVLLIIVAVAVPLAVIIPRRGHHHQTSAVLIPLYIYPSTNTTWTPLYAAVQAHRNLEFTVIVNPSSGPGASQYPDDLYSAAIQTLNGYPNVKTVGYVRTGYATRNISTVISEVNTYAGWASKAASLAMHGIFFDESPHEYAADAVEYMRSVNQVVKNATGLQGDKTVIHNPGTVPDAAYNDTNTDITVVFEDSYPAYQAKHASLESLPANRSAYSFMINSVPIMDVDNLRQFVDTLSQVAEFLFITNNTENFYETFGGQWDNFTSVIPT